MRSKTMRSSTSSARFCRPTRSSASSATTTPGKIGNADLEERLLRDVKEEHFRAICQNALEGLATKKLNLEMLIERRARAQERRVVPETIARFVKDAAPLVPLDAEDVRDAAVHLRADRYAAGSPPVRQAAGLEVPARCRQISPVLHRPRDRGRATIWNGSRRGIRCSRRCVGTL